MIHAENVTVLFKRSFRRKLKALDGFSVQVNPGDVFGLLGPNGAGKSTAMYCFLGLIRPDAGRVLVFGAPPLPGTPPYNRIAYMPEEPHYHLYMTVQEAIRYYASLYTDDIPETEIAAALEKVGLAEFRDLRLEKCSKGMKQKLGIASCLIHKPDLVFLDEPTRGLDPLIVKEFRDIILEMNQGGTTFVINSHILSEVEMVCNRVAIMNHGKVVMQDELRNLLQYDLEHYTVDFGDPGAVPAWVAGADRQNGHIRGSVRSADLQELFHFVGEQRVNLYECSLKRLTLEEAFFNVLRNSNRA
ncbi:MAG: ABC transporter ATP-binding protein [Pseudomonadota bacterium]